MAQGWPVGGHLRVRRTTFYNFPTGTACAPLMRIETILTFVAVSIVFVPIWNRMTSAGFGWPPEHPSYKEDVMGKGKGEVTSKKAATAASKVLRDPKSSPAAKSAAASALTQRPNKKK